MLLQTAFVALGLTSDPGGISQRGIEIPNAILRQHEAYVRCQDDHFDVRKVQDQGTFISEVEKSIAACMEQKAALINEAQGILASDLDYRDAAKRSAAISESFDGYDEMRREMARGPSK